MNRFRIPTIDQSARDAAQVRLDSLTKPPGSLGKLEEIFVCLAGIYGQLPPSPLRKAVLLFAGDHGIACRGVSAYPQRVTREMLRNFDRGGAAINAISNSVGAELEVVDVAVRRSDDDLVQVRTKKIVQGTRDFSEGPALTVDEALAALDVGRQELRRLLDRGIELVALGEMGIGNTSAATALTSAVCGVSVTEIVGPGTGLDVEGMIRKTGLIKRGLHKNRVASAAPVEVLAAVGGAEIAALAGAILESAQHRVPIVLDGIVVGAAALVAQSLAPGVQDFLLAGHLSPEPAHPYQLRHLGLQPILTLDMRLGEGTGAALAMGVIESAVQMARGMATFEEAQISKRANLFLADKKEDLA